MADRGALRRQIQLRGGGCGCRRGLWDRRFHLNARRRPLEAPLATKPSPRVLYVRSSNDVRRRCCATGDGRCAHYRHRVEAGRWEPLHGPEREGARLAFLSFKCRRTVVVHPPGTRDVGVRDATSTRHANARTPTQICAVESRDECGVEHGARHGTGSSPVAQQRRRTSFEDRAKRPRGTTSSRERLQRPSTRVQLKSAAPLGRAVSRGRHCSVDLGGRGCVPRRSPRHAISPLIETYVDSPRPLHPRPRRPLSFRAAALPRPA